MGIDADEIEHDLHHLIMNINDVVSEGKYQSPIWKKRICKNIIFIMKKFILL